MRILNRNLTLVVDTATDTVNCVAGCTVELNAFETASLLVPGTPGFRLRCVLLGCDQSPNPDDTIFTYPRTKNFTNITEILNVNQVFEADVSPDVLNEDTNGADEIRAQFTLINRSNGQSVVKRSNRVVMDF